jgi:hypothetical protein
MLPENITLNTREYRAQVINPTSTLRADPSTTFGVTRTLKVSHDTTKDGIVNSAVIIDRQDVDLSPTSLTYGSVRTDRVMVKFSYDKNANLNHSSLLGLMLDDVVALLTPENVALILNQEH